MLKQNATMWCKLPISTKYEDNNYEDHTRKKSSKLGLTLSEIIYVQNRTNIAPIYANMTRQICVNNKDDA